MPKFWSGDTKFDRKSLKLLHKLSGHEYGGQTVGLAGQILYSGSKDCSLRSWDLRTGSAVCSVSHHRDYITCLAVSEAVQQSSAQNTIFPRLSN